MGWVAKLEAVSVPGVGLIQTDALVGMLTGIPCVRDAVFKKLQDSGYLKSLGLKRAPWWKRIGRKT